MPPPDAPPVIAILGGPNGAGKSTLAPFLLPAGLDLYRYVNADTIAVGLSAFDPESVALQAGRIMLRRLDELRESGVSFAFETTLASRTFVPFLREAREQGYSIQVYYVWLRSPDIALRRVAERVRRGGHFVPDDVVRRRYERGMKNLLELYSPLADSWAICDNSGRRPIRVASGESGTTEVHNERRYRAVLCRAG